MDEKTYNTIMFFVSNLWVFPLYAILIGLFAWVGSKFGLFKRQSYRNQGDSDE